MGCSKGLFISHTVSARCFGALDPPVYFSIQNFNVYMATGFNLFCSAHTPESNTSTQSDLEMWSYSWVLKVITTTWSVLGWNLYYTWNCTGKVLKVQLCWAGLCSVFVFCVYVLEPSTPTCSFTNPLELTGRIGQRHPGVLLPITFKHLQAL